MGQHLSSFKEGLRQIIASLRDDLVKVRTGRSTPALVEDIPVEVYDSVLSVKELATVSVPEPRQLLITAWDTSVLVSLEKALNAADLDVSPVMEGVSIRITLPQLTSERRDALMRKVNERVEAAKGQVRRARQDERARAESLEDSEGKDFVYRLKEEIEEEVVRVGKELEEIKCGKEEEILVG
mgnify:CR=1 FL=1